MIFAACSIASLALTVQSVSILIFNLSSINFEELFSSSKEIAHFFTGLKSLSIAKN
ncbi:Uncharacterised protein [Chlamydia trachomatis]|nr:Uncharacterised protein [Chlamydia trachomatis]